jgi:hypothetical protein
MLSESLRHITFSVNERFIIYIGISVLGIGTFLSLRPQVTKFTSTRRISNFDPTGAKLSLCSCLVAW